MKKINFRWLILLILIGVMPFLIHPTVTFAGTPDSPENDPESAPSNLALGVFRNPVVSEGVISGYFDHDTNRGSVVFYDGRRSSGSNYGFYFSCPEVGMWDYVGCLDPVAGESACPNNRELWYDGHKGIDYEYTTFWHTGAVCDLGRFTGITLPVYAPASGKVFMAGTDPARPANGWHIRMKHDLNGNGNYDDDNFRSIYLHFSPNGLTVWPGQIVSEGQLLGYGGSTGYSSSPHLHFEVQRSYDGFQSYYSADPYGWQGAGEDPWPWNNEVLWKVVEPPPPPPPPTYDVLVLSIFIKQVDQLPCTACGERLQNGGFEQQEANWTVQGVDVITNNSDPYLPAGVSAYSGSWFAWLGGRSNANDKVYQEFTVGPQAQSARLRYAFRTDTQEAPGSPAYDHIYVRLRNANGDLIATLDQWDNVTQPKHEWFLRDILLPDLAAWAGQPMRISFEATTDGSYTTNFYIDEVSVYAESPAP